MKTTLLIMAAGIGSRFGTGIKQLEPVDDAGHIIMDYSIHDALEAGFNHVVFIIRKDIEQEFKEVIGERIKAICAAHDVTVDYAFQDINDIPGTLPEGRTKPWGTGQAVLAAKKIIKTPFIVINADDYYGKEGFKAVHEYLVNGGKSCMAGFVLKNTLSDNGGVTRGICKMDEDYNLTEVVETKNIVKNVTGAEAEGMAVDVDSLVSMNMWGLTPDFFTTLEEGFKEFFEKEVPGNPLKAEYLIPIFIGELLEHGKMSVKVLKTNDLATATIPIIGSLGEFLGVGKEFAVMVCAAGSETMNLISPTQAVLMGALAIAGVPFPRWVKAVLPFFFIVIAIVSIVVTIAVLL